MRHQRRGRKLGRNSGHRKALLRSLACNLLCTEIGTPGELGAAKVRGRIVTTLAKAKEVQPLVERLVTLARRAFAHQQRSEEFATDAQRGSEAWIAWRKSAQWQAWAQAVAPVVHARRRAFQFLRNRQAVDALFEKVAPRFEHRSGGYTRVVRLSSRRLGDAGPEAILEFVGEEQRARARRARPVAERPEPRSSAEASPAAPGSSSAAEDPQPENG